jgi:arginyl-tRNA synthetase
MFQVELKNSLSKVLEKLQIPNSPEEIKLEHPASLDHGDYSSNLALMAAKATGRSPKDLAEEIVKAWEKNGLSNFVEKVEVAGPGFLNIWLRIDALSKEVRTVLGTEQKYGISSIGQGKAVVIDYSAPNIAKPFGIGHLRSTNIGQALYNLYSALGWETIGDNHLGDWGTQFGKLIYQIKKYHEETGKEIESLTIADLEKLYIQFHQEAESKPEMEDEARAWFKRLEEGNPEAKKIWQACVEISLREFNRVYEFLGVKIDHALGESFYLDKMPQVLADAKKLGLLKGSQGAQVIEIPGEELPAMLVKSDGATTYLLRDLATIKYRKKTWNPELYIYEVGVDQALHFRQVFNVAKMLGYADLTQFVHVAHGLIRWPTGKFSTRRGMTIHLEEVLLEAVARARKMMKTAGVAKDLSEEEREKVAQAVGIGGIKYNDLKQNPRTDIIFDWDQIISLSGNSGPYLQYTYARTQSVLRKANFKSSNGVLTQENLSNEELGLLRTFYRFPEVIVEAAENFSPNLLCNFLFDLAQKFNLFYDKQKIIGSGNEKFRLVLTAAVGQILKNGLGLLGIEALEKM